MHTDSEYQNHSQNLENYPLNGEWEGYASIFYKRENKKISNEMNFLCSEKMLERIFRGLVEENKKGENEGEHRNLITYKNLQIYKNHMLMFYINFRTVHLNNLFSNSFNYKLNKNPI